MFWLCFETPKGICVFLQPAYSLIHARLRVALSGFDAPFKEGHELDPKLTKRIPKKLVGKCLSQREAMKLLALLDKK